MKIKLFGLGHSRSFRCLWALHEANLEHQYCKVEFGSDADDGTQTPSYLRMNPQGKVPTLLVSDETEQEFALTESGAILNYINSLASDNFVPTEPRARAKYDELCFFVLTELEQPLWSTGKHRFAIPEQHRIPEMLKTAQWEFDKAVNALEKLNPLETEFVLGDSFTFADILLAQTLNWAQRFKFELSGKHQEYKDRMYQRPAAQAALTLVE